MVQHVISSVLGMHGIVAYLAVGGLAFGEAALFLGFFIPGETAVIVGGVLASMHRVSLAGMLAVAMVAAVSGDSVGYAVGRLAGPWLMRKPPLRGRAGVKKAEDLLARRGGVAVLLGRFVAVVRALIPGIAGMSGLRYRTFLLFNFIGGVTWAALYSMVGFAVGKSYAKVEKLAGTASIGVVAVIAAAFIAYHLWSRRRERRQGDGDTSAAAVMVHRPGAGDQGAPAIGSQDVGSGLPPRPPSG